MTCQLKALNIPASSAESTVHGIHIYTDKTKNHVFKDVFYIPGTRCMMMFALEKMKEEEKNELDCAVDKKKKKLLNDKTKALNFFFSSSFLTFT